MPDEQHDNEIGERTCVNVVLTGVYVASLHAIRFRSGSLIYT